MQIEVPQGKQYINLPNGMKVKIPQGASKVNVPDDMFGDTTIKNQVSNPNSSTSYINGQTPAPSAPQMTNRVEPQEKNWFEKTFPNINISSAKKEVKNIGNDVQSGLNNINSTLGIQPVVEATDEAIDYSQKKSDFENIEFRYRDLLDMATTEGRAGLKAKQEQIDADFAQKMVSDFGADDVVVNSHGKMAVIKDGKRYEINDDLWNLIKDGTWSSRSEIGADVTGGVVGGMIGNLLNKDPKKKLVSTTLGALGGSATASMLGRYVDVMRNAYNTRQKLSGSEKMDIMADAGGGNAVMGVGASAVGGAIAKPSMYVLKRAKSFIADGNLEAGIKHIEEAGYTREQAQQILKEQDEFSEREIPFLNTGKANDQDMLQAVANQDSQLAGDVSKALKRNMGGASGIIENVDGRAKYVIEQIKKNSSTPKEIQENITGYMDEVKQRYKDTKESLLKIVPDKIFDITQTSIPEQIAKFEEFIGTVDGKAEIRALLARINNKGNLNIAEMIDVRGEINSILSKQKKYIGKEAIGEIKATLDQHIDNLIKQMPESEVAEQSWKEAVDDYHAMKDMEGDVAYKDIFNKKATPESVDKALQIHSATINKTLERITNNLPPQEQARIEGRIIESIVEKMTSGKAHNTQAIDFPAVAEKLKELNIKTPEAQEIIELITRMGDMFQNDVKFLKSAEKRTSLTMNQGLSYNVFIRARTMLANQFMGIISKFMTGEAGRSASFKHHVMQSLRRERTPIGFVTKLAEHPEMPAKAVEQLKIIAKQIDEQNQELKAEKLKTEEAERVAKEAADKARNEEIIAKRDAEMQKRLDKENKPKGSTAQSRKVDEAKEPKVGGSEDGAKEEVKELFKKNDDKPTHLTKEDEAELNRVADEDNPFSDNYRKGYVANPIIDNIVAGGAGSTVGTDTDGDGEVTAKDRGINALIAMGVVNAKAFTKNAGKKMAKSAPTKSGMKKGMLVGADEADKGAFSDIATKQLMKEIDDSNIKYKPIQKQNVEMDGVIYEQNYANLGEIIDHPELFKKYPELKDLQVSINDRGGRSGSYSPGIDAIALDRGIVRKVVSDEEKAIKKQIRELDANPIDEEYAKLNAKFTDEATPLEQLMSIDEAISKTPTAKKIQELQTQLYKAIDDADKNAKGAKDLTDDGKGILLHETQHAIQEREGWARGGNVKEFEKTPIEIKKGEWASNILSVSKDEKSAKEIIRDIANDLMSDDFDAKDAEVIRQLLEDKNPLETLNKWQKENQIPDNAFSKSNDTESRPTLGIN